MAGICTSSKVLPLKFTATTSSNVSVGSSASGCHGCCPRSVTPCAARRRLQRPLRTRATARVAWLVPLEKIPAAGAPLTSSRPPHIHRVPSTMATRALASASITPSGARVRRCRPPSHLPAMQDRASPVPAQRLCDQPLVLRARFRRGLWAVRDDATFECEMPLLPSAPRWPDVS